MSPAVLVPTLNTLQAHALALFFAGSYVGSLYVSQRARITYASGNPTEQARERVRRRDDPDVIRARLVVVSISTAVSCFAVLGLVWSSSAGSPSQALATAAELLGLGVSQSVILPSLIAPVLFAGPLYVLYLSGTLPLQQNWNLKQTALPLFTTWHGLRNNVVAPITEEVVFRACILAAYHMAGSSTKKMIFLSPLWFGVAHVHHGWEVYTRLGRTNFAAQNAVISVLFQTAYTTLFGFHCAFLFLRTGSLVPPIASHVFCNIMGLPGFGSDLAQFPQRRLGIMLAYVAGVAGYVYTLNAWTRGARSLYW